MSLEGKLKANEPLARHTSLKIGGPIQFWVEPKNLSDLRNLVNLARKKTMSLRVIGAGSNILADDRGIKGMVLKLNSPYFKRIAIYPTTNLVCRHKKGQQIGVGVNQRIISVGAGVRLARILGFVQMHGLAGFELLAGIPGTVGGALIMNAGNIGDNVLDVAVMDRQGRVKILKSRDTQFNYRSSNLNRYIVLSARFKLNKDDKRAIKKKIDEYLDYRRKTQDLSWPSCGCFFKNPSFNIRSRRKTETSAAYFIERCGLKGSRIGDAAVSSKHANFIINKGKATFADILKLMGYVTRSVKIRFNLDLEPEIKIWKQN